MKHPLPPFWFIFDVESIGLHGDAFAVAAQVFDLNADPVITKGGWWHSVDRNTVKGTKADREWIEKNVPELGQPVATAMELRGFFWDAWEEAQADCPGIVMAAECAWPVEAGFLNKCIEDCPEERTWKGPYPLHDIASIMLAAGMDPMVTYARAHEEADLYGPHHPLGDVKHSAWCLHAALQKLRYNQGAFEKLEGDIFTKP